MSGYTRYPVPAHSRPSGRKRVSQVLSGLAPTAGVDATATPATVAAVAAVAAVTILASVITTPSAVAATAAVPAPSVAAAAVSTPATVAAIGGVPAVTILVGTTATPATVAAVAAVPAATVQGAAIATPATVAAVADVPTPTIVLESNRFLPYRGEYVPGPERKQAGSQVIAGLPATANALVEPATVAGVASVPTPTVLAESFAFVGPYQGDYVPGPDIKNLGSRRAVLPTVVSDNATATPATVAAVASLPAITVHAGATPTPSTVAATAAA